MKRATLLAFLTISLTLVLSQTVAPALWVPSNIIVERDEFVATIYWGEPFAPDRLDPSNVFGYYVFWKPQADPWTAAKKITVTWRAVQLQPLVAGTVYEARIQSVGFQGLTVSAFSATVQFQSDSTRVDGLRQTCTGFFDDFNLPAGGFNPLKWHTSFAYCNDPNRTFSFINDQLHAHSMVASLGCDRSQVASRARSVFDFTGRTGNIFVDLDSAYDRNVWYLEISSSLADIPGHSVSNDQGTPAGPVNSLRVRLDHNTITIVRVTATGQQVDLASSDSSWDRDYNYRFPNIRTPMHILLSTSAMEIRVRGLSVLSTRFATPLSFSRAHVMFNHFSYNTAKGNNNMVYATMHWDNFGFDGPAPSVTTYNYPSFKGFRSGSSITATVNIPDDFSAATAIRLLFLQNGGGDWQINYASTDQVTVNGQVVAIPLPLNTDFAGGASGVTGGGLLSDLNPFTSVVTLQKTHLVRGLNNLVFRVTCGRIGNIHIEIDVPKNTAYSYTPAPLDFQLFAGGFPLDTWSPPHSIGGLLTFEQVGAKVINWQDNYYNGFVSPPTFPVYAMPASATAQVKFHCTGDRASVNHGSNRGLGWAELYVNRVSAGVMDLHGAPSIADAIFTFDSRALPNNQNVEIWIACYSADGGMSANGYEWLQLNSTWNRYKPVVISISSGGGQAVPLNASPRDARPLLLRPPTAPSTTTPAVTTTTPAATTTSPPLTTTTPTATTTTPAVTSTTAAPTTTVAATTPPAVTTTTPAATTTTPAPIAASIYNNGLNAAWLMSSWGAAPVTDVAVTGAPAGVSKVIQWQPTRSSGLFFRTNQCFNAGDVLELRFFAQVVSGSPIVRVNLRGCDAAAAYPSECSTAMRVTFGALGTWSEIVLSLSTRCPLDPETALTGFQLSNSARGTIRINLANIRFTPVVVARLDSGSLTSGSSGLGGWAIAAIVGAAVLAAVAVAVAVVILKKRAARAANFDGHYQLMNQEM